MIVRSFRIRNFKCFRDTETIELKSGFNVFVGQNNSGKSSIIQALKLKDFKKPHLSTDTQPEDAVDPKSVLDICLGLPSTELKSFCLKTNTGFSFQLSTTVGSSADPNEHKFLSQILTSGDFIVNVRQANDEGILITSNLEHSLYGTLNKEGRYHARVSPDRKSMTIKDAMSNGPENISEVAKLIYDASTFHFDAQRISLGRCDYNAHHELTSNASNLPRALLELNESPSLLDDLNRHLQDIIPSIKWVTAIPTNGGKHVDIKTSAYSKEIARRDVLVPLDESGTGVGQVLAILFAAITFQSPKIILIDEPNSFLHPGAAKRLIEVLKTYERHQYILTTHSAEIIAAAEPETIHRTRWENTQSKVQGIDRRRLQDMEGMLADLGITMSDVFGANAILWVEGMTEQLCFPKILKLSEGSNASHMKVIALKDVGRVDKAKTSAALVWDAYSKLCKANALMPPTVAFCLDPEGRKAKEQKEIIGLSKGIVNFLPRRNYESYLLHPAAISSVLSQIPFDIEVDVSVERVSAILSDLGGKSEFHALRFWNGELRHTDWLKHVDGARLLEATFSEIAIGKAFYQKTRDSVALTDWLLQNDKSHLQELIEFVLASVKTGLQQKQQRETSVAA